MELEWGRSATFEELRRTSIDADGPDVATPGLLRTLLSDPAVAPERNLLVARKGGDVTGFLLCADEQTFGKPEFYVFMMASSGPVEAMLDAAEARARASDLPWIRVGLDHRASAVSRVMAAGYDRLSSTFTLTRALPAPPESVPASASIVDGSLSDIEDWIQIENASLSHLRGFAYLTDEQAQQALSATDEPTFLLFASVEGRRVGVASLRLTPYEEEVAGELATLGVLPEYRGHGLGSALLHAALQSMQERGASNATLTVVAENTDAIRLYEQHGFVKSRQKVVFEKHLKT